MKKIKTSKSFYFKDKTHNNVIDLINTDFPISIEENEDLINRIYSRYPIINKSKISAIVILIFQSIRELLISGKILNFNNLFFDTKLFFYSYRYNNHIFPALKVQISTPPRMRKYEE